MTYTPKPPNDRDPDATVPDMTGNAAASRPTRPARGRGAKPNDADPTAPALADDAMDGADEPLLFIAEDELAEDDAQVVRDEEATLTATDMTDDADNASDAESLLIVVVEDDATGVPPTGAGTIDAVADADTVLEAADLELYAEITSTEGMTDAELADAVEIAAAMHEAVVGSAIAEALEEAVEIAADTGEAVIVVVEDEIVGIASPVDLDAEMRDGRDGRGDEDATDVTDDPGAAAGVFGDSSTAYATDADDPAMRMLNVQKPDPTDAGASGASSFASSYTADTTDAAGSIHDTENTPMPTGSEVDMPPATSGAADKAAAMPVTAARMDDAGDEVDADAALSGMVGSMAVAPPTITGADDPAPGVFGDNITAYASDADDPAMRMVNVQKRGQPDRDEGRPPVSLSGDAADTLDATRKAAGMRGIMGEAIDTPPANAANREPDGRESDPLDEGGVAAMTPEPDDTDDVDAPLPLLDETTGDTAPAPENDPAPTADMATEGPSPLMSEEMLDVVEDDAAASAPPYKAVRETGGATDVVRLTAPAGGSDSDRETMPALVAPVPNAENPDLLPFAGRAPVAFPEDVQGGDQPVDTADESDTPPAPEPMVQFVAGGASPDEPLVAPPSPAEYAFTATELSAARENTDSSEQPRIPTTPTPPTPSEPPGELTEEELEEARVDTDEGETAPEPVGAEPATGGRSQLDAEMVAPPTPVQLGGTQAAATAPALFGGGAGAAAGTNSAAATPALAPTPSGDALTPDELAQARMNNDSGAVAPEQSATDGEDTPAASPPAGETSTAERRVQTLADVGVALGAASLSEAPGGDAATAIATARVRHDVPLMTPDDLFLFNEGTHTRLYEKMGAHPRAVDGVAGTHFAVWAPNARTVSVIGPFNDWVGTDHDLARNGTSGIWEGFVPGLGANTSYKYHISSNYNMYEVDKADPFGIYAEVSPRTASVVWDAGYEWQDDEWMRERGGRNSFNAPMSIYEVHIGSWRRVPEDGNRPLTYGEMAPQLADYVQECGFTHVEFLPVMEHPFYGSWGYQVTGYFAPTSRYGTPRDFAYLVDYLHGRGIGVILDWVPSHFPTDQHGLDYFDGTHLYEHADPRQGFHPDWKSDVFNYGRNEVRSFLMSSATYWLDRFHADGLRVDGVASMLYLDYSRNPGEWVANRHGGRENLEAVSLLKQLNTAAYSQFPDIQTTAEESTSWPMVSRPTYIGGLGFGMKWDMGWMHDTLEYMAHNPIYRQYHHNALTFRMLYSFFENFVLPLSHDEVVYLKGSLLQKMGGDDDWQKFANLRLLFGYQWAQSGKKLLFMGGEFGQWGEWNHDTSLDWHLLDAEPHRGVRSWISDLNRIYRDVPALHQRDFDRGGFEWIDANDSAQSVASLIRRGDDPEDPVVIAANFTPVPRYNYRLGVPFAGRWNEILNSDATHYGGSGMGNMGGADAVPAAAHGRPQSLTVTVPPLGIVFFRRAYGA